MGSFDVAQDKCACNDPEVGFGANQPHVKHEAKYESVRCRLEIGRGNWYNIADRELCYEETCVNFGLYDDLRLVRGGHVHKPPDG